MFTELALKKGEILKNIWDFSVLNNYFFDFRIF